MTATTTATERLGQFAVTAAPPEEARMRAATAFLDTVGVTLAGAIEPASRIARQLVEAEGSGSCAIHGTDRRAGTGGAALANGTAAHALDFDDFSFVSLAHPSTVLVPAALAAAETAGASGRAALEAYIVGFEVEGRLGRLMNPQHYERGWHCTSTLGTIGAAAAASRILGLDARAAAHALAIAASAACGVKENFGTMVKPLHAGMAARNGVEAALLAGAGFEGSLDAIDGPQGFMHAFDGASDRLGDTIADAGTRWEIVDTGITVKLYPSCAGTHPALDTILDLRREHRFTSDDVERIEVDVDSIAPNILIHDRPAAPLEGKFSMPFCAAAAVVFGRVGIDTFTGDVLASPAMQAMIPRVSMTADASFDGAAPPLTQSRVRIHLRDGRTLAREARGARGYPACPATVDELAAKFRACASRVMSDDAADRALDLLRAIDTVPDVRRLTDALMTA